MDISLAYDHASTDPEKPTYVALPAEHPQHATHCGLLVRHMCGMQAATDGWQHEYAGTLVDKMGFVQGVAIPGVQRMKNVNLCARCTVMISPPRVPRLVSTGSSQPRMLIESLSAVVASDPVIKMIKRRPC